MTLEKHGNRGRGRGRPPILTLTKSAAIGLNLSCYKQFFAESKYVMLYYDKVKKVVGIQPSDDWAYGYKITVTPCGGFQISCRSLFYDYGIPFDHRSRFPVKWNDKTKMAEICIAKHFSCTDNSHPAGGRKKLVEV